MTSRRGVRQFIKFGLVGSTGFTMNLIVFTLLQKVVPGHARPFEYNIIYTVAFLAGGVSNYYLNRIWTFRSTRNIVREGAQFLSVSTVALAVGLLVSAAVSPWFGHGHKTWFVANVSGIFINFFLNKYWTFKHVN
ncbi:MAG TPA: GtrA family protein [Candidatus Tumulicola sp.]